MRHSILILPVLLVSAAITATSMRPAEAGNRMTDAEACLKQDADTGIAACTRIIKESGRRLTPNLRAMVYTARGNSFSIKGDTGSAISDFNEAIRLDPENAIAYASRGYAYNAKGEHDRAINDYDQAVRLNPGFPGAFFNRGVAYSQKNEPDRAIRDFNEAIRLDPKLTAAYANRGNIYANMGEYDRAIADLDEAIRLFPTYAFAYATRGYAYHRKGDHERAMRDDDEAIRLEPKSPNVYNNRGNAYMSRGELDRAIRDFDDAIRISPNYASAYDSRGEAYAEKGDDSRAVIDFSEAIRLDPNMTVSYVNRGRIYEKQGDIERAKADYSTALARPATRTTNTDQALDNARARLAALAAPAPAASALAAASPSVAPSSAPTDARPADRGPRVALVIGNGGYKNVPVLGNPSRDAAAVASALRKAGFQKVIVENDLRKEKLEATLREFGRTAEGADWALIYYAGHGIEMSGVNYLIPIDAKLETDRDVGFETVPLNHVMSAVEGARKLRLVLLDACRDNPFANQMRRTTASRSIGRGLAPVEPQTGSLVVYAAKDGETALDGDGGNSPFATAFIKEMAVPGVEIRKLFDLVRDDVLEATNNKQQPFTYGSVPGRQDFYFVSR